MRAEFCIFESNAPGLKANFYEPYVDKPIGDQSVLSLFLTRCSSGNGFPWQVCGPVTGCVGINDPIVKERHPVTFPHTSYRPISLQSRMCCAIVLWDEHRFHDDTAPCSFSKRHATVPHVIVALIDQASFLAVEGMLDQEPLPTAVATLGKGRWGVVVPQRQLITQESCFCPLYMYMHVMWSMYMELQGMGPELEPDPSQ